MTTHHKYYSTNLNVDSKLRKDYSLGYNKRAGSSKRTTNLSRKSKIQLTGAILEDNHKLKQKEPIFAACEQVKQLKYSLWI